MRRSLCSVLIGLALAMPAMAAPAVTVTRLAGTYPVFPFSGEFMLAPNAELQAITGEASAFQSFCIEAYEPLTVGDTYRAVVNEEAVLGDGMRPGETPGPNGGDSLSPETAYLYSQFRAGTLAGYDYTPGPGRERSARSLQTAFWHLEGEIEYQDLAALPPQAQGFVLMAYDAGWASIGDVRVLNLYADSAHGDFSQDMLTLVVPVPAPSALLLGNLGIAMVGWLHRRWMT
jgi:hypothetical protein